MRVVNTIVTLPRFQFADPASRSPAWARDPYGSTVCYFQLGIHRLASFASFVSGASYLSGWTSSTTDRRECFHASDLRSR